MPSFELSLPTPRPQPRRSSGQAADASLTTGWLAGFSYLMRPMLAWAHSTTLCSR